MTVTAKLFPSLLANEHLGTLSPVVKIGTDDLKVILIGSGNLLATTLNDTLKSMVTKSDIMAGSGAGALTEVSGTGYTAGGLTIAAASCAVSSVQASGTVHTSITSSATIEWTGATFTAYQAVFIDMVANGGNGQGICFWDFGAGVPVTDSTFQLTLPTVNSVANCLVQHTTS